MSTWFFQFKGGGLLREMKVSVIRNFWISLNFESPSHWVQSKDGASNRIHPTWEWADPSHVNVETSLKAIVHLHRLAFGGESSNKSDSLTGDCTDKVRLCLNWFFPWLCEFVFVCNSTSMECGSDGCLSLPSSKPRSVNCFAIVWLSCTNCANGHCCCWKMNIMK